MRKASSQRNADKVADRQRRWLANHPDYHANYRQQNSDKRARYEAKRRSAKAAAMLGHLTEEQLGRIAAVYAEAKRLTEETGIPHHVDHIIPLQGRDVSGLHVPWNLQVITGSDNSRKGNRLYLDNQALDAVQARKDETGPPPKVITNPYAA
jgi:5-methylcytosine-specific restriction endonuclease McrA